MARGSDIPGDSPRTRCQDRGGGPHIFSLKHAADGSGVWPSTAPFAYLNCILKTISPCIMAAKTVRYWTSCAVQAQEENRNSDFLWFGAARHWLPYGWWREPSAQPQSGFRQGATLAALGSVWFEQLQVSLLWSSKQPQCSNKLQAAAGAEENPGPSQPEAVLYHPHPSRSSSSEPRLSLKQSRELSPRWNRSLSLSLVHVSLLKQSGSSN